MPNRCLFFSIFLLALLLSAARPAAAQKFHRAGRSNNSRTLHSFNPNGKIKHRDAKKVKKTPVDKHIGAARRKDQRIARRRRARQGKAADAAPTAP